MPVISPALKRRARIFHIPANIDRGMILWPNYYGEMVVSWWLCVRDNGTLRVLERANLQTSWIVPAARTRKDSRRDGSNQVPSN